MLTLDNRQRERDPVGTLRSLRRRRLYNLIGALNRCGAGLGMRQPCSPSRAVLV